MPASEQRMIWSDLKISIYCKCVEDDNDDDHDNDDDDDGYVNDDGDPVSSGDKENSRLASKGRDRGTTENSDDDDHHY